MKECKIVDKICFHYKMNLRKLIFLLPEITSKPGFVMISVSVGTEVNYFAQICFMMEANFGNNP